MFIHIDMDAFFVSCEIASFPYLKEKPVVVSTGNRNKGVVASASYEARKFGITAGMPIYIAKSILPTIHIIEANIFKYSAISQDIMQFLTKFSPTVEVASIDEAYLDISFYKKDPLSLARTIKEAIKRNYALPLTIGIGPSRVVAKAICKKSKPDGIGIVKNKDVRDFMGQLKVREIPGIGRKSAEILNKYGINTGYALQNADIKLLQGILGIRGIWFKRLALGKDAGYFIPNYTSSIKSIGHSETLPRITTDIDVLKSYLLYLSIKVSQRAYNLRRMGNGIRLQIKFSDFSILSKQKKGSKYLYMYDDVYKSAISLLKDLRLRKPVRLVGITVYNLIPLREGQELFHNKSLSDIMYKIYKKHGNFSIIPLSILNINTLPKSIPPKIR